MQIEGLFRSIVRKQFLGSCLGMHGPGGTLPYPHPEFIVDFGRPFAYPVAHLVNFPTALHFRFQENIRYCSDFKHHNCLGYFLAPGRFKVLNSPTRTPDQKQQSSLTAPSIHQPQTGKPQ